MSNIGGDGYFGNSPEQQAAQDAADAQRAAERADAQQQRERDLQRQSAYHDDRPRGSSAGCLLVILVIIAVLGSQLW